MHFFGQEAVSRSTRRSARTLVTLSFAVWVISTFDVALNNLVIAGIRLDAASDALSVLKWVVLLFLLGDHIMNWFGDVLSYRAWNVRDKLTQTAGFGSDRGLINKLDAILQTVNEKITQPGAEREIAMRRLDEIKTGSLAS